MRFAIRLTVEAPESTRDELESSLRDAVRKTDPDAEVVNYGIAYADEPFTVVGVVKGKPSERWREVVRAESAADAEAKVVEADAKRIPAATVKGDVSMIDVMQP